MSTNLPHQDFWNRLKPGQITTSLMDMLVDSLVYIKDNEGVYIHVNQAFVDSVLLPKDQILGKTDLDLFGQELANAYMKDDQKVMTTSLKISEKAELVTYRPGIVRWYLTTKIPLFDAEGEVIGMAGLTRPSQAHANKQLTGPMSSISKAVDYIYENQNEALTVSTLASHCGLSISTLERNFKKHFKCSPGKFITQVKMSSACKLLAEPSYAISEICDTLGYSDPVVFNRIFKREMNLTPSAYRKSLSSFSKL